MKPLPQPTPLFTADDIAARIHAMGQQIGQTYAGEELVVLCLLKNSLVFMADLMRAIPMPFRSYTLRVVHVSETPGGPTALQVLYGSAVPVEGQHVLIVDDVVDTGVTLAYVRDHLAARQPKSLRMAVLIDRTAPRKIQLVPEWSAFRLETDHDDRFLVGYGLDHADYYRGLPYVGVLQEPSA
ncbi:MAG: hypoxanthine phosphoribosyltransferase [Vicinamibacteria bacterium]|nr:hypoxanthine phosphoribosyltransferase [Vicinamibacteria bacterium]